MEVLEKKITDAKINELWDLCEIEIEGHTAKMSYCTEELFIEGTVDIPNDKNSLSVGVDGEEVTLTDEQYNILISKTEKYIIRENGEPRVIYDEWCLDHK